MKNKSTLKKVIIALVIIFVIYLIWKNIKGKNAQGSTTATGSNSVSSGSSSTSSASSGCTNTTVLKKGSKCDRVQWSQYKINAIRTILGIEKLAEDGVFGSKTEAAFQKLLGKKTGTWNEVLTKANNVGLYGLSGTQNSNDDFGWYFADGTPAY